MIKQVCDGVLTLTGVVIGVGFTLMALAMGAKPKCMEDE